jgi:hypothetical protein
MVGTVASRMLKKSIAISTLLCLGAAAQPMDRGLNRRIVFHTIPPGATIVQEINGKDGERGQDGKALMARVPTEADGSISLFPLHFRVELPGHKTQEITVKTQTEDFDLAKDELVVYPKLLHLEPDSLFIYLQDEVQAHPSATIAFALTGLAALSTLIRRSNRHRRAAARLGQIEQLVIQSDRPDPWIGHRLGPYLITQLLGEGGMATVYAGVPSDTLDRREACAIKVMRQQFAKDEEFKKRFVREYQVSKDLSHPNIVQVYSGGDVDGVLYIALEMVRGRPLDEVLQEGPLSFEQATSYLRQVLDALVFAHARGVIHRDLKPANLMLTDRGSIKLMDFGLARSHDASKVTQTGAVVGTPAYMPPEQLTGQLLAPTSDQYSLGIMTYEFFTGRRPFLNEDPIALMWSHLNEAPPNPQSFRPELPASLGRMMQRMICKDPMHRFPDLTAVVVALESSLRDPDWMKDWSPPGRPAPSLPQVPVPSVILQSGGEDTIC